MFHFSPVVWWLIDWNNSACCEVPASLCRHSNQLWQTTLPTTDLLFSKFQSFIHSLTFSCRRQMKHYYDLISPSCWNSLLFLSIWRKMTKSKQQHVSCKITNITMLTVSKPSWGTVLSRSCYFQNSSDTGVVVLPLTLLTIVVKHNTALCFISCEK